MRGGPSFPRDIFSRTNKMIFSAIAGEFQQKKVGLLPRRGKKPKCRSFQMLHLLRKKGERVRSSRVGKKKKVRNKKKPREKRERKKKVHELALCDGR